MASPLESALAYWRFDEASWNGTTDEVVDSTGNGYDGTATGLTTSANGKKGRYVDTTAVNTTYIDVPLSLSNSSDFSVAFWLRLDSDTGQPTCVMSFGDFLCEIAFHDTNHMAIGTKSPDNSSALIYNSSYIPSVDGNWHLYVLTYNATTKTCELFVDKVSQWSTTSYSTSFVFTTSRFFDDYYYHYAPDGGLDEVAVWDKVLSQSEIDALYYNYSAIGEIYGVVRSKDSVTINGVTFGGVTVTGEIYGAASGNLSSEVYGYSNGITAYLVDDIYGVASGNVASVIYGFGKGGLASTIYGFSNGGLSSTIFGYVKSNIAEVINGVALPKLPLQSEIRGLVPLVSSAVNFISASGEVYGFTGLTLPGSYTLIDSIYGVASGTATLVSGDIYGIAKLNDHTVSDIYGIAFTSTYAPQSEIYGYTFNSVIPSGTIYGIAYNDQGLITDIYGVALCDYERIYSEIFGATRGYQDLIP